MFLLLVLLQSYSIEFFFAISHNIFNVLQSRYHVTQVNYDKVVIKKRDSSCAVSESGSD